MLVAGKEREGDNRDAFTLLCNELGIAENTFYRCRNRFGGMQIKEAQRLRELEQVVKTVATYMRN